MSSTTRLPARVSGPALATGAAAVTALVLLVRVALSSARGQAADERAMLTVAAGREAELTLLSILGRVPIWSAATLAVVCLLLAARRHHWRAVFAAAVVIVGSNVTTQVLKHGLLDRPDLGHGVHNSLPSGHVTVVVSVVAALLIVVPAGARAPVAGLGTFASGLTGLSTIVAGWHRPADVVAALLVVLTWCAIAVTIHGGRRARTRAVLPTALAGAACSLLGIVLIGVRPVEGMDGFLDASLVLGAVALVSALVVSAIAWISPDA
ncbi:MULTISPECIES: phosphatase PAP2 family protein [Aeromicrobium]|uniref:phosphatase PAP2 family protein n=1 Tax=Aeromicrobium TaxID=2040 RepID=UPI00257AD4BD|nr:MULTISPECIES: phosphatase PAP2 family protein [Aeromicrobium]